MGSLIKNKGAKDNPKDLSKAGDAFIDPADVGAGQGTQLLFLPLDQLTYNPNNPRDEDLLTDPETIELAKSMARLGQQQSASVVRRELFLQHMPDLEAEVPTPWVVMEGNRRKAAAYLDGWETLECVVRDKVQDSDQLDDLPFHTNLHRKGLNPLRVAYYLHDQKQKLGTERAVAEKVGKTQAWVNQRLKLRKLVIELQALVKTGEVTATTGLQLARLDEEQQRRVWEQVEGLEAAARAEFWSVSGWLDNSVIKPAEDTPASPDVENSSDEPTPGPEPRAESTVPAKKRDRRAIVIKVQDRSMARLAQQLRAQLSEVELAELAGELA